jgi:molybdopterin-guanine dinucleotide biosynthesis protein A
VAGQIEAQIAAGERRLTHIAGEVNAYRPGEAKLREIDPALRSFMNVNTPKDYARALAMASAPSSR